MRGGEYLSVDPSDEIAVAVKEGNVVSGKAVTGDGHETHQDPVSAERSDYDRGHAAPSWTNEVKRSDDEVADRDPRKNSINAQRVQAEVRKAVHQQSQQKDDDGASKRVKEDGLLSGALR